MSKKAIIELVQTFLDNLGMCEVFDEYLDDIGLSWEGMDDEGDLEDDDDMDELEIEGSMTQD